MEAEVTRFTDSSLEKWCVRMCVSCLQINYRNTANGIPLHVASMVFVLARIRVEYRSEYGRTGLLQRTQGV